MVFQHPLYEPLVIGKHYEFYPHAKYKLPCGVVEVTGMSLRDDIPEDEFIMGMDIESIVVIKYHYVMAPDIELHMLSTDFLESLIPF